MIVFEFPQLLALSWRRELTACLTGRTFEDRIRTEEQRSALVQHIAQCKEDSPVDDRCGISVIGTLTATDNLKTSLHRRTVYSIQYSFIHSFVIRNGPVIPSLTTDPVRVLDNSWIPHMPCKTRDISYLIQ